jgi:Flp pilus assembly protein TadD
LAAFARIAELKPNDAGALMNLGNALHDAGQVAQAVASYERALQIRPTFAEAHNNLGDRKSTRLNSSHNPASRMPSSA